MEQGLAHTGLGGSALVALLARLELVEDAGARPSFAEGLGHWLTWRDAIPLSAALGASPDASAGGRAVGGRAVSGGAAGGRAVAGRSSAGSSEASALPGAAEREFARVRAALARAIESDGVAASDRRRSDRMASMASEPAIADIDFPAFRRRYVELQQAMSAGIAPLRAQVRAAVARCSPELGRLAAIDAVMDDALREREQSLLAAMPSLLQKHFTRLRRDPREATATVSAQNAPDPSSEGAPDQALPGERDADWLDLFRKDMQRMLFAELDLRLQPVIGLLEALRSRQQGSNEQESV